MSIKGRRASWKIKTKKNFFSFSCSCFCQSDFCCCSFFLFFFCAFLHLFLLQIFLLHHIQHFFCVFVSSFVYKFCCLNIPLRWLTRCFARIAFRQVQGPPPTVKVTILLRCFIIITWKGFTRGANRFTIFRSLRIALWVWWIAGGDLPFEALDFFFLARQITLFAHVSKPKLFHRVGGLERQTTNGKE